jgi:hypothetical protein
VLGPGASFRFTGVFSPVAAPKAAGEVSSSDVRAVATAMREGLLGFIEGDLEGKVATLIGPLCRAL